MTGLMPRIMTGLTYINPFRGTKSRVKLEWGHCLCEAAYRLGGNALPTIEVRVWRSALGMCRDYSRDGGAHSKIL